MEERSLQVIRKACKARINRILTCCQHGMYRTLYLVNPDNSRGHFVIYCLFILVGLILLYRKFIFSAGMIEGIDMITAGIFFRSFLIEHVDQFGSVPLWNPYIFCGLPYVDSFHGDIFYPLSFLKYLGNIFRMLGFTLILHVCLAGVFAYLAARQLKMSRLAATVVGVSYMFSGWLNSLAAVGYDGKVYVTALLPLAVFFLARAFDQSRFLNSTMLAVVIGLIILTPHPQMAYYTLWLLCAYTVFRLVLIIIDTRRAGKIIAPGILAIYAVCIGLCLSAIQMLPGFVYTIEDSARTLKETEYGFAASWSLHQEEAISMIVPEFCGFDDAWIQQRRYWGRNSFKDNSEYIGLVPLLLAFAGIILSKRRNKYFFVLAAAASFLYAMGIHTPFFKWCYTYVPLLKSTRAPSMVVFLFSFSISVLAGIGIDSLRHRASCDRLSRRIPMNMVIYGLPLLLLIGAVLYTLNPEAIHRLYLKSIFPEILTHETKWGYARDNFPYMAAGFWIAFSVSVITAIIIRLSSQKKIGPILLLLTPVVIMADGIRFSQNFICPIDPDVEFAPRPHVEFVRENVGQYRAFGFACNEQRMHIAEAGIMSPIGRHGNELVRYHRLLNYRGRFVHNFINPRFVNLVGAKYIICPASATFESVGYKDGDLIKAAEFEGTKVMQNTHCFPRTYLVGRYAIIPSIDSIYSLIYGGSDNLRKVVYLETDPGIEIDSSIFPEDTAVIVYYSVDSIVISARCSTCKILTISDNDYKDWRVFIDGEEKMSLITYGTFRGVVIEPGEHIVVWKYIPSTYQTGKIITLATAAYVFIALAGYILFRHKRRRFPGFD